MTILEADGITITGPDRPILDRVSVAFGAEAGLVGLIGPNGAGKTTLLKSLLGLRRADSGAIRLDGKSLEAWKRPEIARRVGYLAQGAPCHWPMTAERIVALGVLPDAGRVDRAELEARVVEAMERTGTIHLRARNVTSLSGGERSLVMIARCLAGGAPLLLADEPVTGLDPRHQIAVMRTLAARDNTHEGGGTGRVVVLHDLGLAARFCSRLVLLAEGRILADGPPCDVLTESHLATAYEITATIREIDGQMVILDRQGKSGNFAS